MTEIGEGEKAAEFIQIRVQSSVTALQNFPFQRKVCSQLFVESVRTVQSW